MNKEADANKVDGDIGEGSAGVFNDLEDRGGIVFCVGGLVEGVTVMAERVVHVDVDFTILLRMFVDDPNPALKVFGDVGAGVIFVGGFEECQ